MKNVILNLIFMFFVPFSVYCQTEQQQKINIRNGNSSNTSSSAEQQQKTQIKSSQQSYQPQIPNFNQPIRHNPYSLYYDRWNRWGAPYSYMYYENIFYRNRWDYRAPARIYYLNNGNKDTIFSKKNKTRLGLNLGTKNQIGTWVTVGKNVYFKGSFNKIVYSNESTFYTNISMDVVQRWVSSNPSQNYKLNDIIEGWNLYLGIGKEFGNFGANISLGIGEEKNYYQYFDGTYILSNNGKYSFKKFFDNYTTFSVGITHDIKFLSLSADYDPIRKSFWLGAGFNF